MNTDAGAGGGTTTPPGRPPPRAGYIAGQDRRDVGAQRTDPLRRRCDVHRPLHHFIVRIFEAPSGTQATLDDDAVGVAAGLTAVLGSHSPWRWACRPTPTAPMRRSTTRSNEAGVEPRGPSCRRMAPACWRWTRAIPRRRAGRRHSASGPRLRGRCGRPHPPAPHAATPDKVKVLAVAFAGYVVALINTAYGVVAGGGGDN
jgi:hypothetical protein